MCFSVKGWRFCAMLAEKQLSQRREVASSTRRHAHLKKSRAKGLLCGAPVNSCPTTGVTFRIVAPLACVPTVRKNVVYLASRRRQASIPVIVLPRQRPDGPMTMSNGRESLIDTWRHSVPSRLEREDPFNNDGFVERPCTRLVCVTSSSNSLNAG